MGLKDLENLLGHKFQNESHLLEALTHSSYSNECNGPAPSGGRDNERFEFLGDAVIGLVIASSLMHQFPDASEGQLSRWRSLLVSRKGLSELAVELGVAEFMLLGRGERRSGGAEKSSILAGFFEAVVGALYIDGGLNAAQAFLLKVFQKRLDCLADPVATPSHLGDRKSHLQERIQSLYKTTPIYRLAETWGLEHEKCFRVEIIIDGKVVATGEGRSKKEAEQEAAQEALLVFGA